jgi:hypothetical protein
MNRYENKQVSFNKLKGLTEETKEYLALLKDRLIKALRIYTNIESEYQECHIISEIHFITQETLDIS